MWVGGVADSQTRSKPLKKKPNHPENCLFDPNFNFRSTKSHKNPGVGGWVYTFGPNDLGEFYQEKTFFLFWAPL